MCQCYQIGGPFIAEDPECPTHGTKAQADEARRARDASDTEGRFEALERRVAALEAALEAAGLCL